jgi:hypothetical protein
MEGGKTSIVKDKLLYIEDMLLESSSVPTLIDRVRFKTDIGDITWKPSKRDIMMVDTEGFKIKRQRDRGLYIQEMPKKIYQIRDALAKATPVAVKSEYVAWSKTPDQVYYFFSEQQIEEMELQKDPKQETEVKDGNRGNGK